TAASNQPVDWPARIEHARHFGYSLAAIAVSSSSAATAQRAAEHGKRTPASSLPYSMRLQQAFGHYNISDIQAHQGPQARASARAINALAFASGNHIVFAQPPDLHTTAHGAAHVVQQRAGVQLTQGIDTEND